MQLSTRILVVDDEPDFVEFLSFNLRKHGYEVLTASNGFDALLQASRQPPDLVVLDIMMEGVDGYSVCRTLRHQAATRSLPIILLTAAGGQIARRSGLASGANEFLTKPVTARHLMQRIEDLLASQQDEPADRAENT